MANTELTLEAKEAIRSYLIKLLIPSGAILAVVSFALGFFLNDIAKKDAYSKAYEEATRASNQVIIQSAMRISAAESDATRASLILKEALTIADKLKGAEWLTKSDAQFKEIAKELAKNQEFINRVNPPAVQIQTLSKWVRNIYSKAREIGQPKHEGANWWWQKSLIDSAPTVDQELPK